MSEWVLEAGLTCLPLLLPPPGHPEESKCFWVGGLEALGGMCPAADPESSSLSLARLGKGSRKMAIASRRVTSLGEGEAKTEGGHRTRPVSASLQCGLLES